MIEPGGATTHSVLVHARRVSLVTHGHPPAGGTSPRRPRSVPGLPPTARRGPRPPLRAVQAGAAPEGVELADDDALPADVEEAAAGEGLEDAVHRRAGAPDHARDVGLGELVVEDDLAAVAGAALVGEPQEQLGHAPVQVEEDQVGRLLGEPPDDAAEH